MRERLTDMRRLFLGLLAAAGLAGAQAPFAPASLPSFEVASIKPLAGGRLMIQPARSGRRITWNTHLSQIITYAFHLPAWRVESGDLGEQFYEIDAAAGQDASEEQVRQMFQRLLAERFHLAAHWETKELPGFAL